MGFADVT